MKKNRQRNYQNKKQKRSNKIKENTAYTIGETTINTIVNASTSIAVQFQFDAPTFEECWNAVWNKKIIKLKRCTQNNYSCSFARFRNIHKRKINTITLVDLQPFFDKAMEENAVRSTLCNMKCVLNYIFDYAMKYDYAFKFYPDFIEFDMPKPNSKPHKPFEKDEIQKVYQLAEKGNRSAQIIMIMIYTGMRPMELTNMQPNDVHINESYMVGGVKTFAGKNRTIPIHPIIKPYIVRLLNENNKNLMCKYSNKWAVDDYRETIFYPTMEFLEMEHQAYDTRHTFATLANEYHMDEIAVKRIIGHKCGNLTQDVYTHTYLKYLQDQITKIPKPDEFDIKLSKFEKILKIIKGGDNNEK